MRRVLVTGVAGFIGSHLAEALLAEGREVVGLDNFDPTYPRAIKEANLAALRGAPRFRWHEQDLHDVPALAALLDDRTAVVHLAARAGVRPSVEDPVGYVRANVGGTAAVACAMRQAGASQLVFASSSSVYGDATPRPFHEDAAAVEPVSPYAASKRAGELLLASLAACGPLSVAALRFFTVFGPRQRPDLAIHAFARRLVAGEPVTLFGDGTQARGYTYVGDAVRAVQAALGWLDSAPRGVTVFNVCGDAPVGLRDMLDRLAAALGVEPRITWAPAQPGDVQETAGDATRARERLGFVPAVDFDEGLHHFVAWFREAHATQL